MLVRKLLVNYIVNIVVHFVGNFTLIEKEYATVSPHMDTPCTERKPALPYERNIGNLLQNSP